MSTTRIGVACAVIMMAAAPALRGAEEPARSAPSAAASAMTAPAPPFVGTVTGHNVNVRAGGNLNYEIIHQIARGEPMLVIAQQGEWYAVELPPEAGTFIAAQWVAREGMSAGRVTGHHVNIRGGPGTKFNSLGQLAAGVPVTVLSAEAGWLRVVPPPGARGWIHASLVTHEASTSADLVRAAYQARAAQLAANATAELPPTAGSNITAPVPSPAGGGSPAAQGRLERARGLFKRPAGTHRLVHERRTIAYLTGDRVRLDDFLHQDVAVWGDVTPSAASTPHITVTQCQASR